MSVQAPPSPPGQEELEALIEEARRHARKRRLRIAALLFAAALLVGAAL